MSRRVEYGEGFASDAVRGTYGLEDPARALALAAGLVLTGSYVSILYHVTDVVGGSTVLLALVGLALLSATALARYLRPLHAAVLSVVLLGVGIFGYLQAVPYGWTVFSHLGKVFADTLALLTGLSVLRMTGAGVWALGFAPAPVFLSWYLFVRQRYAAGAAVGGIALALFVLTGDAGTMATLAGVGGAATAIGFGEIERREGTVEQMDTLVVLVTAMVLLGTLVTVVPGGRSQPLLPNRQEPTVEGGLLTNTDRVSIVGSIRLSPKVRFVVRSNAGAYWRVGAYDRYTGQGWVRSGRPQSSDQQLPYPEGDTTRVEQTYTAYADVGVMPAAWRPVRINDEIARQTQVTSLGGLKPIRPIRDGESYTVVSAVPEATPQRLRTAGTDYPADVEETYTQLPKSTPDRVGEFTDRITEDAETPYAKAVRIEQWLEANKEYSLDIERPKGNVAASFLFEMEEGYCTYFATTMVAMLRSQGIPARFVVGYTSGQRIAEDEWVVRALDSHAWVEVYFPDVGWVRFDPTPSGARQAAESEELEEARENNESNVDVRGSENGEWTPTPAPDDDPDDPGEPTPPSGWYQDPGTPASTSQGTVPAITPFKQDPAGNRGGGGSLPSREALGLGLVAMVGLAAGLRRSGLASRGYRLARVRWQGTRRSPEADTERAFDRLESLLGWRYRERRPGETRRSYLASLDGELDDRVRRVDELYHRARYGDGVTREEADEAIRLVDRLVRETPLVAGWFRD